MFISHDDISGMGLNLLIICPGNTTVVEIETILTYLCLLVYVKPHPLQRWADLLIKVKWASSPPQCASRNPTMSTCVSTTEDVGGLFIYILIQNSNLVGCFVYHLVTTGSSYLINCQPIRFAVFMWQWWIQQKKSVLWKSAHWTKWVYSEAHSFGFDQH